MHKEPFNPCPICNKTDIANLLHTKDYSLTNESFEIIECAHCTLRYTFPIPSIEQIAPYYNFPDYISHTDTTSGWMNKLYHAVRNRTLDQKSSWVQSLFTGYKGKLLEVGAGTGAFAHCMKEKQWEVTALEPDASSRQKALENYNLSLQTPDTLYQLAENSQDVICLWHVLEHVHDLKGYLKAFKSILKTNGRLIIAVPNYTSYDAQYYKKHWAAYDVPRHLYHFSPASIRFLLKQFDMQLVQIKPMWYDSYYVSLLSEKYKKSGFIGVIRALIVASISNLKAFKNSQKASSIIYEIKKKAL
jgi:2-polyprenyl-3-methyl-5-hydroxy-6-metoxy-1,4-benzoquinol methylase